MSKSNFPNFPSSSNNRPLYFKADFPQFSSGLFNMKGGDPRQKAFLDTTIGEYINKNITELFAREKKYSLISPQQLKAVKNYMVAICTEIIEYGKKEQWKAQEAYINKKHSTFNPKERASKAHEKIKHIKDKQKLGVLKAFIIPIMTNFMKEIKKDVTAFNKKKLVEDAADDKFTFDIMQADFLDDELQDANDDLEVVVEQNQPQYSMLPRQMPGPNAMVPKRPPLLRMPRVAIPLPPHVSRGGKRRTRKQNRRRKKSTRKRRKTRRKSKRRKTKRRKRRR